MRIKIALAAVAGVLLGLVPMTGAVQAEPSMASVRIIHNVAIAGIPPTPGPAADVYVDDILAISNLAYGDHVDTSLPGGTHSVVVCAYPSLSSECAPPSGGILINSTPVVVAGGGAYTFTASRLIGFNFPDLQVFANDNAPTGYEIARLQFNNTGLAPVNICIDGVQVDALSALPGEQTSTELAAGSHNFGVGVISGSNPTGLCSNGSPIEFAAGSAFIFSLAFTPDMQVLVVGQDRPDNTPATPAFCTDVVSFGTASKTLTTLLAGITPAAPQTYPTAAQVNAAVDAVTAAIASGDSQVPASIKPQWEIVTAGLRDLTTGLQLVGGDVAALPLDSLAAIVAGVRSTTPNPEIAAATEVLTHFYLTSCMPAPGPVTPTVTPKFTG